MKSLLSKIAVRKAVGVYLGEHEVAVSKLAATPLGPVEIAAASEPYTPENLAEVLERLLGPLLGRKRRLPVAVGLASSRLFFGTRLANNSGENTPEAVLQKALSSPNIDINDLTVDLLGGQVNKLPVTSMAACRKKYISSVVATLSHMGVRPARAEPGPCALARLAAARHRFPRRCKLAVCVFLGATQGLAVMVARSKPLAWRSFPLLARAEGFAILSAARTLQTQHRHHGLESSPDYAIIHGRPDLHERLKHEQFPTNMGMRVVWREGPGLDAAAMASGVAHGCLSQNVTAFDLSRSLKARASIWEIFPWWDLAYAALLVVFLGVVLARHSMRLNDSYAKLRAESGSHKCLAASDPAGLEKEKKELEQKVEAVRKFLDSRILWTAYTKDIPGRLPVGAQLNMFQGLNQLDTRAKKASAGAPKQSFSVRAVAPCPPDGSAPREIDAFLTALRNDPLLKGDFASVELAEIKRSLSQRTGLPITAFTVMCLPEAKGAAKASKAKVAKKGGKLMADESGERRADLKSNLLSRLHDPLQLRICVMAAVLLVGYGAVYRPLSGRIDETTRKLNRDKKLLDLAVNIERLKQQYETFQGRLPQQIDAKEWVQYVLEGMRRFEVKLAKLDCREPKQVGPYRAVVLQMELEGGYFNLDRLLRWLESNQRLFRADDVKIVPSRKDDKVMVMQLTLLGLMG